jgi:hypothetical protein
MRGVEAVRLIFPVQVVQVAQAVAGQEIQAQQQEPLAQRIEAVVVGVVAILESVSYQMPVVPASSLFLTQCQQTKFLALRLHHNGHVQQV